MRAIKVAKMKKHLEGANFVADRTGLEPATSAVTGRHSNQLNYRSKFFVECKYRSIQLLFAILPVKNLNAAKEKLRLQRCLGTLGASRFSLTGVSHLF